MKPISKDSLIGRSEHAVDGKAILLASLIGDALALGPHWIYDQNKIAHELGEIDGFHDPISRYHEGKTAGDQTHYGDQMLVLLRSILNEGAFDLARFADAWRVFWEDPATKSYVDGATRHTLNHLQGGGSPATPGSSSNDIAGAARIAPLFLDPSLTESQVIEAARSQTAFTHGDTAVAEAAEFFVRVVFTIRGGASIPEALKTAIQQIDRDVLPSEWVSAAESSASSEVANQQAVKVHGLTCHIPDAFPAVLHLLLRHPEDPVAALKANVHAGGDSASRGLLLGLVYGAAFGLQAFPDVWFHQLKVGEEILNLST